MAVASRAYLTAAYIALVSGAISYFIDAAPDDVGIIIPILLIACFLCVYMTWEVETPQHEDTELPTSAEDVARHPARQSHAVASQTEIQYTEDVKGYNVFTPPVSRRNSIDLESGLDTQNAQPIVAATTSPDTGHILGMLRRRNAFTENGPDETDVQVSDSATLAWMIGPDAAPGGPIAADKGTTTSFKRMRIISKYVHELTSSFSTLDRL